MMVLAKGWGIEGGTIMSGAREGEQDKKGVRGGGCGRESGTGKERKRWRRRKQGSTG